MHEVKQSKESKQFAVVLLLDRVVSIADERSLDPYVFLVEGQPDHGVQCSGLCEWQMDTASMIYSFDMLCSTSIETIIRSVGCRAICEFESIAKECTKQNERENFNWEKHRMLQDKRSPFVQSWQVVLYLFCSGKWFVLQQHQIPATYVGFATNQFEQPLRGVP